MDPGWTRPEVSEPGSIQPSSRSHFDCCGFGILTFLWLRPTTFQFYNPFRHFLLPTHQGFWKWYRNLSHPLEECPTTFRQFLLSPEINRHGDENCTFQFYSAKAEFTLQFDFHLFRAQSMFCDHGFCVMWSWVSDMIPHSVSSAWAKWDAADVQSPRRHDRENAIPHGKCLHVDSFDRSYLPWIIRHQINCFIHVTCNAFVYLKIILT